MHAENPLGADAHVSGPPAVVSFSACADFPTTKTAELFTAFAASSLAAVIAASCSSAGNSEGGGGVDSNDDNSSDDDNDGDDNDDDDDAKDSADDVNDVGVAAAADGFGSTGRVKGASFTWKPRWKI